MLSILHFPPLSFVAKILHVITSFCIMSQVTCLHFNCYPNFTSEQRTSFIFKGSAGLYIQNTKLQLTPESFNTALVDMHNQSGGVLCSKPLKLWRRVSKDRLVVASFNTTFQLFIQPVNGEACAEGIAFILTSNLDPPTNCYGQWLGIVNETTNGSSSNGIVAIEFDTRKSYPDDLDDNHVGVNVNGLNTNHQFALGRVGVNLSSGSNGSNVLARIQYDGEWKRLTAFVSMADDVRNDSIQLFSIHLDLSEHLSEDVYVGFSASTGEFIQLNYVNYWNFSSTNVKRGRNVNWALILPVILSVGFLLGGSMCCYLWGRRMRVAMPRGHRVSLDLALMLESSTKGPRKFQFKELKSATMNFNRENRIGRGGFGMVYKGFLQDSKEEIAVKRVSKDSRQGEQEFAAEVLTISRLSHKNLVNLIGWCHEKDELLLVYEFMPNRSLDKHLFPDKISSRNNILLSWERRHKIICGVASALSYLHDGCRNCVLHRDVKSSNVMLDYNYDARLGDFGLARTILHDGEKHHLTTKVAGTPGYIAPECLLTGRASVETDVFGFGVFTVEVACGKRPGNNLRNPDNSIVDWLWDLYGRGRVLDAVDPQLHGVFDEEQMELVMKLGLACCHPNPNQRPSMRVSLQVLNGEAPAPTLPTEKPTFMWPVLPSIDGVSLDPLQGSSLNGGCLTPSDLSGR